MAGPMSKYFGGFALEEKHNTVIGFKSYSRSSPMVDRPELCC